mmetsp:Transcript_36906/g.87707  ORF Transcript_36906/g.87707 Transcript_36906/m.87707 type:complete len:231 (-) Transcript_36906:131-823(-)
MTTSTFGQTVFHWQCPSGRVIRRAFLAASGRAARCLTNRTTDTLSPSGSSCTRRSTSCTPPGPRLRCRTAVRCCWAASPRAASGSTARATPRSAAGCSPSTSRTGRTTACATTPASTTPSRTTTQPSATGSATRPRSCRSFTRSSAGRSPPCRRATRTCRRTPSTRPTRPASSAQRSTRTGSTSRSAGARCVDERTAATRGRSPLGGRRPLGTLPPHPCKKHLFKGNTKL